MNLRQQLAADLGRKISGCSVGTKFGHGSLVVDDKVFAFTRPDESAALKLPATRIAELLVNEEIRHLRMGERKMREWVVVPNIAAPENLVLLREAMAYVASLPKDQRRKTKTKSAAKKAVSRTARNAATTMKDTMKKRYTLEQKRWDSPVEHAMPTHARVPASFTIGNVVIAPATVLAPMAGVTDTVFRRFIKNASLFTASSSPQLCHPERSGAQSKDLLLASDSTNVEHETTNQQSGCGLIMTEFTSADGLSRMRETKRKRYLTYYDDEHPISAQLFGSNPDTLADSARIVQDAGFDIVDLNLGCPAKRVVACNGGSGLLKDLPHIERIFKAIRSAVTIPFTVKFRLGWNDQHIVCVELARMAEDNGLNAVALHARTREDGYTGQARWEYIAAVKDAVRMPVIGNGDIRTPEDAAAMIEKTSCDAVMIGRTAPANPWIFRQIAQYTASKEATGAGTYDIPTNEDRYRMIRTYFQMLVDEIALEEAAEAARAAAITAQGQVAREQRNRDCVGKMKQFASWFTHGVPGGGALRKQIFESKNGNAVLDAIERFFESHHEPAPEVSDEVTEPSLEALGAGCD